MPGTRTCDYCGAEIEPGTGTMFVRTDGSTVHYCSAKCEKNADLGREPRDVEWTEEGQVQTGAEAEAAAEAAEAAETEEESDVEEEPETETEAAEPETDETETTTIDDDEPDEPEDDEE